MAEVMTVCETCGGWNGGLGGFKCGCIDRAAVEAEWARAKDMPHSQNPGIREALNHPNTRAVVARVQAVTRIKADADRAAAERTATIADGERRRSAEYDRLPLDQLAALLIRRARVVANRTGLEPIEAAKTSECHEVLKALVDWK